MKSAHDADLIVWVLDSEGARGFDPTSFDNAIDAQRYIASLELGTSFLVTGGAYLVRKKVEIEIVRSEGSQ